MCSLIKIFKTYLPLFVLLGVVGCGYMVTQNMELPQIEEEKLFTSKSDVDLAKDVKKVFDSRCIVCHSCYNSPCRLKLSSYEGVLRGGHQIPIYGKTGIKPLKPLRLGVDQKTTKGWRSEDFYPVIDESSSSGVNKVQKSLLFKMLTFKKISHGKPEVMSENSHNCPSTEEEFDEFRNNNPSMGMPFGMSGLTQNEYYTVGEWIRRGAKDFMPTSTTSNMEEKVLKKWDKRLNGQSIKVKLSSRYIYEHLFLAHIHFNNIKGKFYKLVRSKTPYPETIYEIATTWPYDDPLVKNFYYRFKEIRSTIVHKTHITYKLSDKKLKRYNELFYDSNWRQEKLYLPPYGKFKSNPFITFMQIPTKSRYQFLLDDAYYHVKTFIRGPVCKGQIALNVIDDHFSVFFMKPESDQFVNNKKYSLLVSDFLEMPASGESDNVKTFYRYYKDKQKNYTLEREKIYNKYKADGFGLDDIWDGDGHNQSATLTIYRHFDSASVMKGFKGGYPKTVWMLDYPIFERIYYNLVAGFNVYGNISHKSATRRYMDDIRVEAEDNFLNFLPKNVRIPLRKSWYIGNLSQLKRKIEHPQRGMKRPSKISFSTGYYVAEFIETVLEKKFPANLYKKRDDLNCCELKPLNMSEIKTIKDFESHLKQIINKPHKYVLNLPDLSLLRIKVKDSYRVYTFIRNRAHLNISFMFFEEVSLDPDNDRLNVHRDYVGSYPNKIFDINIEDANSFLKDIVSLSEENRANFYKKYAVARNDPKMWKIMDWFHADFKKRFPIEAGVFDLNRLDASI